MINALGKFLYYVGPVITAGLAVLGTYYLGDAIRKTRGL